MIRQLRIHNFKIWKDTGNIRMAPISLFFGANSSGKSSIGQFLMMLKQTVESPDRKAVFYPGGRNSAVQLGSYQEMVFSRNPNNKIAFEYQWSFPDIFKFKDPVSGQSFSGNDRKMSGMRGKVLLLQFWLRKTERSAWDTSDPPNHLRKSLHVNSKKWD